MDLYVFSSKNLTNIWAGIGAGLWAVSRNQAANIPNLAGKAARMLVGSVGILYCSDTHAFTTPFLVSSKARDGVVVRDVWPEEWTLPFGIHALGTPRRQLHKDRLREAIPTIKASSSNWDQVLHVQPVTVFVPSTITSEDWQAFLENLADRQAT